MADVFGIRTTRCKPASFREFKRIRNRSLDRFQTVSACYLNSWNGKDQELGIGMPWICKYIFHLTFLNDPAGVHYSNAVGDLGNHAKIMSDQENRHIHIFLQLFEQVQDLGLDSLPQGSCRLISNDHSWIGGQGNGDHYSLAKTARELMGIYFKPFFGIWNPDFL